MARRLLLMHQMRRREFAEGDSKLTARRDPEHDPYAKVDAQRERREDRDNQAPARPAAPRITRKKKKTKKKLKKAA